MVQGTPDVSLQIQRFRSESSSYIEVSIYIVGSSLVCVPSERYGVEYIILVKDTNENIVAGNKYRLTNTSCPAKDLIDVKRFGLQAGKYTIEVEMNDIIDSLNLVSILQEIEVEPEGAQSKLSDIQLR